MSDGVTTVLEGGGSWKGYLAAAVSTTWGASHVICAFGDTPTANDPGWVRVVRLALPASAPVDAGTVEPPPPPPPEPLPPPAPPTGSLIFTDDFNRTDGSGLGANWQTESGLWLTRGFAQSDLDGSDVVRTRAFTCTDCRAEARVIGFGVPVTALFVREGPGGDRYQLVLTGSGALQLQRIRSGVATVLATASSGLTALNDWATLSLSVTGANPVTLTAAVNGAQRLQVADSSTPRLTAGGFVGLHTTSAGVAFDDVKVSSLAQTSSDAGTPPVVDAGVGGAGDAGALPVDAGSPRPDGGATVDGGTSTTDAGTSAVDAGPGLLFADDFNRPNGGLGSNWEAARGLWLLRSNRAQSDLDGANLLLERPVVCADCRVESALVGFGVPQTALVLRVQSGASADRYELYLANNGALVIRRWRNNVATTLGTGPSGISDLSSLATLSLTATGSSPVTLTATVGGAVKLTVTDGTAAAITGAGRAGLATGSAGVVFDAFRLVGTP